MSSSDPIVSMIGAGSAPAMLAARALLAGNGVAHRWIDIDTDPVGRLLAENVQLGTERPVAVFADGSQLPAPEEFVDPGPTQVERGLEHAPAVDERRVGMTMPARRPPQRADAYLTSAHWLSELARRAGLRTQPERELYDVVIVGAGPATPALRYWEEFGLLPPPERLSGQRRYRESAVAQVGLILLLSEPGFSLSEQTALAASRRAARDEWRHLYRRKLAELDEQIARAQTAREAIEHGLRCPHEDITQCPNFRRLLTARLAGQPLREAHSH